MATRILRALLALLLAAAAGGPARAQIGLVPDDVAVLLVEPVSPLPDEPALGYRSSPAQPGEGEAVPSTLLRPGLAGPERPLPGWGPGAGPAAPPEAIAPTWAPRPAAPDSLPDGMPFYTSLLWGEHGAVRAVGLAPSTRRGELVLRRQMLQWHQRMGLATLGALTAQVVLGELIAADRAGNTDLVPVHRTLGYVTFGMYLGTASLSLGAPPARRYGGGFSNIQLHRYLALVHFTGMMAQPWLGAHLANADSPESYDARLKTHQWVGRITSAAFGAAVLSIFFGF
jgi:hypothetical protein